MSRLITLLIALGLGTAPSFAQAPSDELQALRESVQELTATVRELSTTVQSQQQRITELESGQRTASEATVAQTPLPPLVPAGGPRTVGTNLSAFNPEIGAVADITAQLSESSTEGEGNDKLSVREVEIVFGHPIDPYSRFDLNVTFSDFEEAGLEEAYVTHWGLPGEIAARLGRFRQRGGKASGTHTELLDTVDTPLVVARYLGTEGLFRTGAELSGFVPAPWTALTHELSIGAMEGGVGEGGALFGETRRRPSFYAHLTNFWEVTDTTSAELGTTYLTGSSDADSDYEVDALGLDATVIHYVTPTNKLKWQNEVYLQNRAETVTFADDGSSTSVSNTPWGLYSLLDYRLSPRFGMGGRFDYVEPINLDPLTAARDADTAWSGYFTFYQSEFARWRLQARHTNVAAGGDDNTVFVQGTVAIGVHKHQLQ